jgi:hypothetical protein
MARSTVLGLPRDSMDGYLCSEGLRPILETPAIASRIFETVRGYFISPGILLGIFVFSGIVR